MDTLSQPCILLLNLPPSALGGIDLLSFTTTPRFQGIKSLPPGFHFVFTSPTTALSIRHGAWFYVDQAAGPSVNFWVKKWDSSREELLPEGDQASILRRRANLGSIWREGLTPYRQSANGQLTDEPQDVTEGSEVWETLTSCINAPLLARITGGPRDHWSLTSASSASVDVDHIPGLTALESIIQPERELTFLPINLKQTWRKGATGRERTDAARDRTWALNDLISHHCVDGNEMEVLGELQFSFLMVLTLDNNSCLEQWKRILGLLFTCVGAVHQRPTLFVNLIMILKLQLRHAKEVEGGLFDFSEDGGTLLRKWLREFKRGLEQEGGPKEGEVMDKVDDLEDFVNAEFGWELRHDFVRNGILELEDGERIEMDIGGDDDVDELGEYAPTVVELTPQQMNDLAVNAISPSTTREHLQIANKAVVTKSEEMEEDLGSDELEENDPESMASRY